MVNQHIQKLIDAEQQADAIVRRAKDNWTKKVKEAQSSAAAECAKFKQQEEQKFKKEFAEKFSSEDELKRLDEQLKHDIEEVRIQFKANRDKAITLLLQGVVRVDLNPDRKLQRRLRLHYLKTA